MSKNTRKEDIIKLISEFEIDTQEELTEKLVSLGHKVSQATVSRDINELNLIKIEGLKKKFKYSVLPKASEKIPENLLSIYRHVVLSVVCANNLIVVKTLSGNGSSVGMTVDYMKLPQIIGTVAGDDVLLIITANNSDAEIVASALKSI